MAIDLKDADLLHAAATVLPKAQAEAVAALSPATASTLGTVLRHASVRRFAPDDLPDDVFAAIRAALLRGPTSSALHSYSHVLVREPELKARLAELAGNQRFIADAPLLIVGCADLRRTRLAVHAQGYRYTAHDLRMLISATADLSIGLQNASLVAQSLGFGTVMLGGVLNGSLEIAKALGLPERVAPLLGLSVGRPADGRWPQPQPRLPATLLLHEDGWNLSTEAETALLHAYDQETRELGTFEGRRIAYGQIEQDQDDPVPLGAYGWLEHTARKQGRRSWGPQGAKVDHDLPALGLKVRGTGEVDEG